MKANCATFFFFISALLLGAKISATNTPDFTPLYEAIDQEDVLTLRKIAGIYDNINAEDAEGRTVLTYAINNQKAEPENLIVKCLLNEFEAKINILDGNGHSPLFYAFEKNKEKLVIYLLQNEATLTLAEKNNLSDAQKKWLNSTRPVPRKPRVRFQAKTTTIATCQAYNRSAPKKSVVHFQSNRGQEYNSYEDAYWYTSEDDVLESVIRQSLKDNENLCEEDHELAFAKHQSMLQPKRDALKPRGKPKKIAHEERDYVCAVTKEESNTVSKIPAKKPKKKSKEKNQKNETHPLSKPHAMNGQELIKYLSQSPSEIMQKRLNEYPSQSPEQVEQYFNRCQFFLNGELRNLDDAEFYKIYTEAFELKYNAKIIDEIKHIPGWRANISADEIITNYSLRFEVTETTMIGDCLQIILDRDGKKHVLSEKEISFILDYIKYISFKA
jgi:hypothetical protein